MDIAKAQQSKLHSSMFAMLLVVLLSLFIHGDASHFEPSRSQGYDSIHDAPALSLNHAATSGFHFAHPRQNSGVEWALPTPIWWVALTLVVFWLSTPLPKPWFHQQQAPPSRVSGWRDSNLLYRGQLTFEH